MLRHYAETITESKSDRIDKAISLIEAGKVHQVSDALWEVEASKRGRSYEVTALACECADFRFRTEPCKHQWASVGGRAALALRKIWLALDYGALVAVLIEDADGLAATPEEYLADVRCEFRKRAEELYQVEKNERAEKRVAKIARFDLGRVVATIGALRALADAGEDASRYLERHRTGDWGEISEEDRRENEFSVDKRLRLLSVYRTAKSEKLWVITEADRSATTLLLPSEY